MEDIPMTIFAHLRELRKRILLAGVSVVIGSVVGFSFVGRLSTLLRKLGGNIELIYISPSEALVTDVKLSVMAGVFLSLPVVAYQIWAFVFPALDRRERGLIFLMMFLSTFLFVAGSVFACATVLPMTMAFFTGFAGPGLSPLLSYNLYVSFVVQLTLMFGLVFQMPLVIVLLSSMGLVTPHALKRSRKMVIFLLFIAAAILTPPDVISQILMALPMLVLFEFSILLSSVIHRRKSKARTD